MPHTKTPSTESPRQRLIHLTLVAMFAFAGVASPGSPAHAGTITYTWHEDDGQPSIEGTLVVSSAAQTAGSITQADIISFTWIGHFATYTQAGLQSSSFPIPISTSTAGFSSASATLSATEGFNNGISVDVNSNYATPSGELFIENKGFGHGHWTISTVPEPGTATMVLSALACGGVVRLAKRRKD